MAVRKDVFRIWLNKQYQAWKAPAGQRKSVRLWAQSLGVNRDALSHWLHGIRRPDRTSASVLAQALGLEVYELLDMVRPDPVLQAINQNWRSLDHHSRRAIKRTLQHWLTRQS